MRKLINTVVAGLMAQWYVIKRLFTKKGQKELAIDDMNQKLQEALMEKTSDKIKLRRKIFKDYASKKQGFSRYIPFKVKSNERIKKEVIRKYGDEMNDVGLKITDNLELK